ncbi:MAG: hypothetical protein U5O15_08285 [Candidatus Krumholzibacteriota bacterium]|nr:hypothetical protein [Candidatus Krumholzibacteriota bacterium]
MMAAGFDKIRILLLDDRDSLRPQDGLSPRLKKWFDVKWIATPSEARAYRDSSWVCITREPELLNKLGWVPEIFVIDYALTQEEIPVLDRVRRNKDKYTDLSPLPNLEDALSKLGISSSGISVLKEPPVTPSAGSEFWGCYIGGLILSTFADYPVSAVTITRYGESDFLENAKDVAFFEWMMEKQTNTQLKGTGAKSLDWTEIISEGAIKLRERIKQLASIGIITLDLEDILQLIHNTSHPTVSYSSRYGKRSLPVQGLFIDERDEKVRKEKAKKWAEEIIEEALTYMEKGSEPEEYVSTLDQIEEGLGVARDLWDKWEGEEVPQHMECSRIFGQVQQVVKAGERDLKEDEIKELDRWCAKYDLVLEDVINTLKKRKYTLKTDGGDIRAYNCDVIVKRWAILFTIVRLAIIAWHASRELDRDIRISSHDVYMALFPLAINLPYYLHEPMGKESGEHTKYLKRLNRDGSTSSGWGEIGISVVDVLAGKDFDENSHGLFSFERKILRMFSVGLGCGNRQNLKKGSVLNNILFGPF